MGTYEVLDRIAIADVALDVDAVRLDDLFETAARALADTMVDPATIAPTVDRLVRLTATSLDLLFFDWLSELIYLKDRDRVVFTHATVHVSAGLPWTLSAHLTGGSLDAEGVAPRADVKAATFHQFCVEREPNRWHARFVLDI